MTLLNMSCPCGSNKDYADCCSVFINGQELPKTPEQLMRSRYSAYSQANVEYIQRTMKSPAADDFDLEGARHWASRATWLGLEVKGSSTNGKQGFVEFIAHYSHDNKKHIIHEWSEFRLDDGQWFYIDGKTQLAKSTEKISRNDPCPCGSEKKYKKCCGAR